MPRGVPDVRALYKWHRIIKNLNPDIVHSHLFHANLFGRIGRIFSHVPVFISTIHNIYEGNDYKHYHDSQWRYFAYRITNWLSDYTTIISQTAMEHYLRKKAVPRKNFHYVPNGINVNNFYQDINLHNVLKEKHDLKDQFVWLAVGRIEEPKDYPTLIKAFREVANKKPEATLMVVGDGFLKNQMIRLSDELFCKNIKWLGKRADIPDLMKMADAYVMSSSSEGMPIVLLEAAASELPIVATNVGGNREVVVDGKTGYLVNSGNAEELAKTMLSVMNMSIAERRKLGIEGRQYVSANYSIDKIVTTWESLYCHLFQQK
ncbi:glycosyltransferase [Candidatus Thiomargarita nelsonii]|uniref:Glycosyltransferase n=1 Tax=Candidatus Thiomargarita nelsonii TaxID=1003181 RepID=A0A176S0L8_9GAMM|nr:glycosyltransferase [Candidatus Thiomargarita nelsonii]